MYARDTELDLCCKRIYQTVLLEDAWPLNPFSVAVEEATLYYLLCEYWRDEAQDIFNVISPNPPAIPLSLADGPFATISLSFPMSRYVESGSEEVDGTATAGESELFYLERDVQMYTSNPVCLCGSQSSLAFSAPEAIQRVIRTTRNGLFHYIPPVELAHSFSLFISLGFADRAVFLGGLLSLDHIPELRVVRHVTVRGPSDMHLYRIYSHVVLRYVQWINTASVHSPVAFMAGAIELDVHRLGDETYSSQAAQLIEAATKRNEEVYVKVMFISTTSVRETGDDFDSDGEEGDTSETGGTSWSGEQGKKDEDRECLRVATISLPFVLENTISRAVVVHGQRDRDDSLVFPSTSHTPPFLAAPSGNRVGDITPTASVAGVAPPPRMDVRKANSVDGVITYLLAACARKFGQHDRESREEEEDNADEHREVEGEAIDLITCLERAFRFSRGLSGRIYTLTTRLRTASLVLSELSRAQGFHAKLSISHILTCLSEVKGGLSVIRELPIIFPCLFPEAGLLIEEVSICLSSRKVDLDRAGDRLDRLESLLHLILLRCESMETCLFHHHR